MAVFEEARVESVFSVGIWLEPLLKDLTVFQTCLHPCLETFLKYYMYLFHFLRIVMTSFLSEVYFFHKEVQFSLLICIHCFSHFCFDVPVHPGDVVKMYSFIISMNLSPTYLMLSLCWDHCIKDSSQ